MNEFLELVWELSTVTYEEVLDAGISKGTTNWQMYGSKKPFNKPYKLVDHYQINKPSCMCRDFAPIFKYF